MDATEINWTTATKPKIAQSPFHTYCKDVPASHDFPRTYDEGVCVV